MNTTNVGRWGQQYTRTLEDIEKALGGKGSVHKGPKGEKVEFGCRIYEKENLKGLSGAIIKLIAKFTHNEVVINNKVCIISKTSLVSLLSRLKKAHPENDVLKKLDPNKQKAQDILSTICNQAINKIESSKKPSQQISTPAPTPKEQLSQEAHKVAELISQSSDPAIRRLSKELHELAEHPSDTKLASRIEDEVREIGAEALDAVASEPAPNELVKNHALGPKESHKSQKEHAMDRLAETRGSPIEWGKPAKAKVGLKEAYANAKHTGKKKESECLRDLMMVGYEIKFDKHSNVVDITKKRNE